MYVKKVAALAAATCDKINSAPIGNLGIVPVAICGFLLTTDLAEMQFMVRHVVDIGNRLRACFSGKRTRKTWHGYPPFVEVKTLALTQGECQASAREHQRGMRHWLLGCIEACFGL